MKIELSEEAIVEESSVVQTEGTKRTCSSKTTGGTFSKVRGMLPVLNPSKERTFGHTQREHKL